MKFWTGIALTHHGP